MQRFQISVRLFIALVMLIGVGLACLLYASAPWACLPRTVQLAALVISPLGVIYRRGARRAFWAGFALLGWGYLLATFGPWLAPSIAPNLPTTRLLAWSYPLVIPEPRRPEGARARLQRIELKNPTLGQGLTPNNVSAGLVDIVPDQAGPSATRPLAEGVECRGGSFSGTTMTRAVVEVNAEQAGRLTQAQVQQVKIRLVRHPPDPLAGISSPPPVDRVAFEAVGQALCGLVVALIGGLVGRWFYATRDKEPRLGSAETAGGGA
jgi:hypothetical protein